MALLRLEKLTVRFGGLLAVQNFDCAVNEREIFSIIGPNGAGKTTVFNAVTGIYEPTSGRITFHDRPLERPFTWRVAALAALVGLLMGLVAAVLAVDVNALWKATIKRNFAGPGEAFSYRDAWNDAWDYLRGTPALDRVRGQRWAVRTADARRTLGFAKTHEEAEAMRTRFEQLIATSSGDRVPLEMRDGQWAIVSGSGETLAAFDNEADAQATVQRYGDIARESANRRIGALLALAGGIIIGSLGTWAVWSRARRSPEVIARAGIARTFQNIRLFGNMSVLDNVLVGMDRQMHGGVLRMALQTPGIRREEQEACRQAKELLSFVGLAGRESLVARNLPYGDQRRLEIARALATGPELVLFDEPAAGMNPTEALELNGLIEQIRGRGLSVLLIEHHMKVVMKISDRIAVLEYGRKIAEGTPDQVRADSKVIAAYLGSEGVT
jgi:branched-chain amino acid transport system ATP-binding protein